MDRVIFLHTGELWLDRPIRVRGGLPPSLAARILEAPRRTMERICQVALREDVDLVVFSGNMIDCSRASPCDLDLLVKTFDTLARSNISIVWMAGEAEERGPWPAELPLTDSVYVLSAEELQQRQIPTRKGPVEILVCPSPCPWDAAREALLPHKPDQLVIGLTRSQSAEELPNIIGVVYWALSSSDRKTESREQVLIHSPGAPLVRDFSDDAFPTVTVAEWHAHRRIALREVSVGAIRYATVTLLISGDTQWPGLSAQLVQELESRRASSDADWLIRIKLQGPVEVLVRWKREGLESQLVQFVQSRYLQEPFIWPVEVIWDPIELGPDEWFKEKSYRGEFLRQVNRVYEDILTGNVDPETLLGIDHTPDSTARNMKPFWEEFIRQSAFEGWEVLADLVISARRDTQA